MRAKRGEDEVETMTDGADAGKSGMANYEDPNCNVSLPVFSIHGNHDDPAGEANFFFFYVLVHVQHRNSYIQRPLYYNVQINDQHPMSIYFQ